MKIIHHLNYFGPYMTVYCEKQQLVVKADADHHDNHCMHCPYFAGHLQGDGVECSYPDSTAKDKDGIAVILSPEEQLDKRKAAIPIEMERQERKFIVKK